VIRINLQYSRFWCNSNLSIFAYDVINDLVAKGELLGDPIHAQANFRKGLKKAC
jgi:hypothetical protein